MSKYNIKKTEQHKSKARSSWLIDQGFIQHVWIEPEIVFYNVVFKEVKRSKNFWDYTRWTNVFEVSNS